jgi:hypothetical protein
MPWFRPAVGIALTDGVGELDTTAAFEVYGQSAAARTVAIAAGDIVRTRHGLRLLTTGIADAPHLSRLVVPGAAELATVDPRLRRWADRGDLTIEPLAGRGTDVPGGGFTAALRDLATHTDAATARTTAKMIGYPTNDLGLRGGHRNWRPVLLTLAALALAVLLGGTPARLARRGQRRSAAVTAAAPASDAATEPDQEVTVHA